MVRRERKLHADHPDAPKLRMGVYHCAACPFDNGLVRKGVIPDPHLLPYLLCCFLLHKRQHPSICLRAATIVAHFWGEVRVCHVLFPRKALYRLCVLLGVTHASSLSSKRLRAVEQQQSKVEAIGRAVPVKEACAA